MHVVSVLFCLVLGQIMARSTDLDDGFDLNRINQVTSPPVSLDTGVQSTDILTGTSGNPGQGQAQDISIYKVSGTDQASDTLINSDSNPPDVSITGTDSNGADISTTSPRYNQPDADVAHSDSTLPRDGHRVAFGDEPKNPIEMIWDAGTAVWKGLTNSPGTPPPQFESPPLIRHPPQLKETPTTAVCPDGTGQLCCFDKPEKSKPRHIAAPYNSDPNIIDFRFTHHYHHQIKPRADKDSSQLFDFHDCTLRMIPHAPDATIRLLYSSHGANSNDLVLLTWH